jgi:hypothetical protein
VLFPAALALVLAADPSPSERAHAAAIEAPEASLDPPAASTAASPSLDATSASTLLGPSLDASSVSTAVAPLGGRGDTWIDQGHAFVQERVFRPVIWVDRFFSDERDVEPQRSRSFLRVRQELDFTRYHAGPRLGTSINATLVFPSIDKRLERLRLELVSQSQSVLSTLFPGGTTEVPAPELGPRTADAGLGLRLWQTVNTHADIGAGFIVHLPPGAYTKLRFRFAEPFGKFLARQAVTGFWRTDTHLGATGSAELERPLSPSALARLSGSTTITQQNRESRGFDWAGDLSLISTVKWRLGVQVGYSISGATALPVGVEQHHFYLRLRRDFYRRWIFLELEPDYGWPWAIDQGRRAVWSAAFRVEVQFQGVDQPAPRPPPAPPPPEVKPPAEPAEPANPPGSGDSLPRAPATG